jgi:hypothetical protein
MKQLYYHNDKAYLIHRKISISLFSNKEGILNMENVKVWRDYLEGVDRVLQTSTHFLFVEEIHEAEILEDENI